MKNLTKKSKIIMIILAVIIVAGIAVALTAGFNVDLRSRETKKVELYLQKEFEISDIRNIINEVMPDEEVLIQTVETYEDTVSIIAPEITDEQKQALIEKVNEKYELELTADETETLTLPRTRIRDMAMPYVVPFAIATVIILVYMAIRYRKANSLKVVLITVASLVVAEAVLLALVAITRIPVGRLTIPMVLAVYVATLVAVTTKFEKDIVVEE